MYEITLNELDLVSGGGRWVDAIESAANGAGAGAAAGGLAGAGLGLLGGPFAPVTVTGGAAGGALIGGGIGAIGGFAAGWNDW
ncbi:hypothetical protein [Neisseria yangbaofengii]|uniref:hypothetical protein n=1 Tax=Neisseria yangbaofengii TaxID=2709396 RepID=UPI0013EC303E|nr:hypothetical protein [Neisseria yangbaofengii]